jgi:gamma-glutamylaminecyclotransferase
MCVIIIKENGKQLPTGVAKKSAKINPHGLGIVWLDTFDITYHKSSEYKKLETDRPFIAHFRYATVGAVGLSNTHPFQCGDTKHEYLMMNGTIKGLGDAQTCDSKVLAQSIGIIARSKWKELLGKHDCRFVTVNTNKKTYQIYNKELWTRKNDIWYSKDNVLEDNLVAVYGTLKLGNSNYYSYLYNANHIGKGHTLDKYPLIVKGLPYLIDEVDNGHNVEVDIFAVSDTKLAELDRLEGHPNWYERKQIKIKMKGKVLTCWIYFNLKESVTKDSVLHKSFVQPHYKPKTKPYSYNFLAEIDWYSDYKKKKNHSLEDSFVSEFDTKNEKPMCPNCYHDLEDDRYSNYYCYSCFSWFAKSDVKMFGR